MACTFIVSGTLQAQLSAEHPNIVVILADDLGYGDVGFNGCRDIPTPNIDSLARNGVRCTDAYATHPFCSPSRAALLTGRYQQRFGHEHQPDLVGNVSDPLLGLPPNELLLPQILKPAGYVSGLIGKWHLGISSNLQPTARGFDEFFGFLGAEFSLLQRPSAAKYDIFDRDLLFNRRIYSRSGVVHQRACESTVLSANGVQRASCTLRSASSSLHESGRDHHRRYEASVCCNGCRDR